MTAASGPAGGGAGRRRARGQRGRGAQRGQLGVGRGAASAPPRSPRGAGRLGVAGRRAAAARPQREHGQRPEQHHQHRRDDLGAPRAERSSAGDPRPTVTARPCPRAARRPPATAGSPSPTSSSRCGRDGPDSSAPACTGSVGPVPKDGQSALSVHAPQAGFLAWQTRRPWKITRCDTIVQSRLGTSAPIACSTLTGSSSRGPAPAPDQPAEMGVHGDARARRRRCRGSRWPSCGRSPAASTSSSSVRGSTPSCFSTTAAPSPISELALFRKKPVEWIICSSSARSALA